MKYFNSSLSSFKWFCEPESCKCFEDKFIINSKQGTDFWQNTHYGFSHDNGHFLYEKINSKFDFILSCDVEYISPNKLYDQAGLMIRLDSQNWIKCSHEYKENSEYFLGSVSTNLNKSDWAYINENNLIKISYRIEKNGLDFLIYYKKDQQSEYRQMRVAYLSEIENKNDLMVGIYACSPTVSELPSKTEFVFTKFNLDIKDDK